MSTTETSTRPILIRAWLPSDSVAELTELLHRAYLRLADMGLRFMASHQSEEVTRKRIAQGVCLVALADGRICGTILYRDRHRTSGCAWYDRPEVASLGQFAVDPTLQAKGLGSRLLQEVEGIAFAGGAEELALDTAEPAHHLTAWYGRLGYRVVGDAQWSHTNYPSVILSKQLVGALAHDPQ